MIDAGNIAERLLSRGEDEAPAILNGDEVVSYSMLRARAHAVASGLANHHAPGEQRIGLLAENGPFFVVAYLGVIRAGFTVVPFPVDYSERMLARLVASMGILRILVSARHESRLRPIAERIGVSLASEAAYPCDTSGPPPILREIDPGRQLAAIMLTSGSTGEPKGVLVSHRNIAHNTHDIVEYMRLSAADRVMVVLPFSYCYGASLLHTHLAVGATLVVNNRFMFPTKVLDDMEAKRCSGLAGVPSTYQILLRKTDFAQRRFPALRWFQQAGGKLPTPFLRELRKAFPHVRLYVMYGQTEATARLSFLPPEQLDRKPGSIGRGLPSARLEVLREDGTPVRPGSDEVGEIVASGESVTGGYWADPEETRRFFRGGKLYTGDLAHRDADGDIYIVERAREFVKSMGNRVSPKEVEDVIAELEPVVEVAVVGVPDEIWGEALKAFIVTSGVDVSGEEVRLHCLRQLPNHKVPQYVEFLPCLPKTANGKIAREKLRALSSGATADGR
jgi:acyl-CoA synthetase (AMP-forming)/AMP-acid ligase II